MGKEITPEELFGFAMTMDGDMGIKNYLDVVDRFFKKEGSVKHGDETEYSEHPLF